MIKTCLTVLRKISIGGLYFTACFVIAFVFFIKSNIPQDTLKQLIESQLQKQLGRHISIESVSGNLLKTITLNNVSLFLDSPQESRATIKTLSLHISILSGLANRGNLIYGLKSLEISDLTLFLTRNTDGAFELASLFTPKPGSNKSLFHIKTNIKVKNSSVFFRDEKGWSENQIQAPFEELITISTLTFNIDTETMSSFNLIGTLNSNKSQLKGVGQIDLSSSLFDLDFSVDALNIDHWGEYILPLDDLKLEKNDVSLTGSLSNKNKSPDSPLPFSYNLYASLHQNKLSLSFLNAPIDLTSGELHYYQNNDSIQPILELKKIIGSIANTPFKGDGMLFIYDELIDLKFQTPETNITHLYTLFPDLASLELEGSALASLYIKGNLLNPELSGQLISNSFSLFSYPIKASIIDYFYKDYIFYYTLHKGNLFNTPIHSKGRIDLTTETPKFKLYTTAKNASTTEIFPNSIALNISSIKTTITGTSEDYTIYNEIKAPDSPILNQSLPLTTSLIRIKNNKLSNISGSAHINSNKSLLQISSSHAHGQLHLSISGENLTINDIEPSANHLTTGELSVTCDISLNDTYPFTITDATLNASSSLFPYQKALFSGFNLDTHYQKGIFKINSFSLENAEEKATLTGEFQDQQTGLFHINFDKINIKNHTLIQNIIPEEAKPFSGKLSGNIWIKPQKQENYIVSYDVSGNLKLIDAKIQNQAIDSIITSFSATTNMRIHDVLISKNNSILQAKGTITNDNFDFSIDKSLISLQDFKTLLFQYGNYSGNLECDGHIYGTPTNPKADLSINFDNLKTNFISLSKLKGDIVYDDEKITLTDFYLEDPSTKVSFSGFIKQAPLYSPPIDYSFDINIQKIEIEPFTLLIQNMLREYQIMTQTTGPIPQEKITNANITTPYIIRNYEISFDMSSGVLFSLKEINQALSHFETILAQKKALEKPKAPNRENPISGLVTGDLHIQAHPFDIPKINGTISITNLKIPYAQTDIVSLSIESKPTYMNYILETGKGIITGREFESIKTDGYLNYSGTLSIKKTELKAKNQINSNIIHGTFPLTSFWKEENETSQLNLTLQLKKNDINLLSFMHPSIRTITNDGELIFHLGGSVEKPIITATSLKLINASLIFNDSLPLFKEINIPNADLTMENNKLIFPETVIQWRGLEKEKKKHLNSISVHGFLELTEFSILGSDQVECFMELYTSKSSFPVSIPNFYTGEIALSPLSMIGTYTIPLSASAIKNLENRRDTGKETGPLISGKIEVKNGNFELPKHISTVVSPSLLFNLDINIKKDIFMSGSFFGSGSLAAVSVDLETEETIKPLRLTGSNNTPRIENKIQFKDGNINIFNREFTLLSYSDQAQYNTQIGGELLPNEIYFSNSINAYGKVEFVPVLNLSSVTIVDQILDKTTSENTSIENEYAHIVSKISGSITNLSKIRFDYYTSSLDNIKNNNDLTYVQSYYISNGENQNTVDKSDRSALLKLLFPELFSDSSNQLLSEYGETRVNLMFKRSVLRPIEKQIANGIGLYDLKIDYNLGSDLFNSPNSQSVGINMMQQLFRDQLYLRIKTDIELEADAQTAGNTVGISEIELTYYLLKNLSLNYANIKENINTDTNFRPKVSLRFSHEF